MKNKPLLLLPTIVFTSLLVILPLITSAAATDMFENPLSGNSITDIIENLIKELLALAASLLIIGIIVGGIYLVLGGIDNEQSTIKGKRILLWVILGALVIGAAAAIMKFISDILFT